MAQTQTISGRNRARLAIVLGVSSSIFVLEVVGAYLTNSLALLADAGHVLADVAGIGASLLAIWVAARPPTQRRTFGFYRLEILAAVVQALLLFGIAGFILFEAARRFEEPPEVASAAMLAFAVVGVAANLFSAWLLRDAQRESLNLRGAFLEVLSDAVGSGAVIVAAVLILTTGLRQADAIASAFIGVFIVPRTWRLLRDAVDVLLEATPKNVDMSEVRRHILEAPGVRDVHDLHVWTITSGMNVVSAHVIVEPTVQASTVLDHLCRCLGTQFDIDHSTFQLETADRRPLETAAHR